MKYERGGKVSVNHTAVRRKPLINLSSTYAVPLYYPPVAEGQQGTVALVLHNQREATLTVPGNVSFKR